MQFKWLKAKRGDKRTPLILDTIELKRLIEANYHKPYNRRAWIPQELYNKTPKDFDCSSFVMWLYFQLGYKIPRVSQDQYTFCQKSDLGDLRYGDLFFLGTNKDPRKVNHVGIYIGSGMCAESCGGSSRTMKVIYSVANKNQERNDWVSWGRVPLEEAQDKFFKWVEIYPMESK